MPLDHFHATVKDLATPIQTIVHKDDTIEEALQYLREKQINRKIIYIYVVDEANKLCGIIPTRKLLLCDNKAKVADVMQSRVIALKKDQSMQDAMELFARYNLLALPVVDEENYILGAIDVETYLEESFDIADARHRHDIFQMIGISLESEKKAPVWKNFQFRMPWILCNMIGGVFCAVISRYYSPVLAQFLLLAMFIPLVLSLSESISMQSMTYSLQMLRKPHLSKYLSWFLAKKEMKIIFLMALSAAIIVGGISLFWRDSIWASATIAFAILLSIFISASVGLFFPIFLHKTRLDPKVASGPVVLALADIMTMTIYLSLATWWLLG